MERKTLLWLIGIMLLGFMMRMVFFVGFTSGDDLGYATFAHSATQGPIDHSLNFHGTRIGMIYTTAISYAIFGVNEFSTVLFPFIMGMLFIVLVFFIGRFFFNDLTGLVASFLMAIYPFEVFFSTALYPDLPAAFLVGLAAYLFLLSERKNNVGGHFVAGIVVGLAYLMKELSVVAFIFFGAHLLYTKKVSYKHASLFLGFLMILFVEAGYYVVTEDDAFYRFTGVQNEGIAYMKLFYPSYFGESMPTRLFLHYPHFLWNDPLARVFYALFIVSIGHALLKREEKSYPLVLWAVVMFLFLNFGSMSLSEYIPLPVGTRYIEFIALPCILLSSRFIMQKWIFEKKIFFCLILLFLFVSSVWSLMDAGEKNLRMTENVRIVHEHLQSVGERMIYADSRTTEMLELLFGYRKNDEIVSYNKYIVSYPPVQERNKLEDVSNIRDAYIIIDKSMIRAMNESVGGDLRLQREIDNPPREWILEKSWKGGQLLLYFAP